MGGFLEGLKFGAWGLELGACLGFGVWVWRSGFGAFRAKALGLRDQGKS